MAPRMTAKTAYRVYYITEKALAPLKFELGLTSQDEGGQLERLYLVEDLEGLVAEQNRAFWGKVRARKQARDRGERIDDGPRFIQE